MNSMTDLPGSAYWSSGDITERSWDGAVIKTRCACSGSNMTTKIPYDEWVSKLADIDSTSGHRSVNFAKEAQTFCNGNTHWVLKNPAQFRQVMLPEGLTWIIGQDKSFEQTKAEELSLVVLKSKGDEWDP